MNSDDLKNKGNKAFSEGRYDQAIIHFTDAINVDPKNHILYSNRSGAYASMKEYKKALEDADKTIDIKPDWPKGYSRKVTALIYLGNYDEAEKVANQGLEVEPGNAQLKQGLEDIKKAKSNKNNEESAENMIGGLFKGDVLAKLAASPETARYMTQPDFVNIIQQIQKNPALMNAYMKDPRVLSAIGVLLGVPLTTATPEQFAQQQEEEQRRQSKPEPKKEEPKKEEKKEDVPMPDLTPEKKQAEEEKAKGNDAYKKKDFDTAIAHYSKAFELDPENVIYLINRSAAKFEKGDYLDCIKDCELSIEEGRKYKYDYKNVAKAYTRMGNAYMKLDNLEQAIVWYDKSLTEDRNATTLGLLQKAEKTKEERDKKAYLDPTKAKEAKERGNNLFKENQYPEAIKEYTEALKRDPTDHTLYSNRSACYTKMGEYGLVLKDANKCIEMKPDFAKGYSRKGHCHFFMKEYEQAMKAYDKGLEIDPNNAEMTEGVKRTVTAMNAPQPGQKGGQSDEERLAQAAKDPEVQQILSDPVMRQILQDMQSDPSAAQNHLKNPLVMQKVQKLVNAGVLKVGSR